MLNSESFVAFSRLPATEVIGSGVHVYEVLWQNGTAVTKLWVNGNSYKDAVTFFCMRYNLKNKSKQKITTGGVSCYRLNAVDNFSKRKPYEDAVMRMVY